MYKNVVSAWKALNVLLLTICVLFANMAVALSIAPEGGANSPNVASQSNTRLSIDGNDPSVGAIYLDAEQFVHANLYDAMAAVWAVDRKSWNQVLYAHACVNNAQSIPLQQAYQALYPLFSEAMQTLSERANQFDSDLEQAILADVAQLGFRLFSSSYAHGYARQVVYTNSMSDGVQEEMCGAPVAGEHIGSVDYEHSVQWSTARFLNDSPSSSLLEASMNGLLHHANYGYQSFKRFLALEYSAFDALVYSHAYQNMPAYNTLFVHVTEHENVKRYTQELNKQLPSEVPSVSDYSDFAFLTLSSGYHWGTMSVLALVEEEYPSLHVKIKRQALDDVRTTTERLAKQASSILDKNS
ncbi:hypothetical protein OE749_03570 [Aestuariibacter sp. AA17]|uniref:Uncharacterized protein n=1 Tax=Fluctibacter corallii TaxID=2984329 RepID=A0ABT3A526_9ALTE|nr:hypothetical protein [Aestuariibacter sp. AA17]MCV2883781.1 hypothetical protein [Aestuariibacter sp. AA17]